MVKKKKKKEKNCILSEEKEKKDQETQLGTTAIHAKKQIDSAAAVYAKTHHPNFQKLIYHP